MIAVHKVCCGVFVFCGEPAGKVDIAGGPANGSAAIVVLGDDLASGAIDIVGFRAAGNFFHAPAQGVISVSSRLTSIHLDDSVLGIVGVSVVAVVQDVAGGVIREANQTIVSIRRYLEGETGASGCALRITVAPGIVGPVQAAAGVSGSRHGL